MKGIIKANNYLAVYLLLILIINLYLLSLPLTSVFGYEFSAINALLLSFLSGLYTQSFIKSNLKAKKNIRGKKLLHVYALMLLVPFLISSTNSFLFGFCSFWDGFLFYFVITCPAIVIGSSIGSFAYAGLKSFNFIAFLLLYFLILLIPFIEIYFNPQLYIYNPLFAFFPGTIYDEGLTVDLKLIMYRIFNLIFFFLILYSSLKWIKKTASKFNIRIFISIFLVVAFGFYYFISPALGFTTTESRIRQQLSKYIESRHFVINADKRIKKEDLKLITLNLEYYYAQLSNFFKCEPDKKITVNIFYNKSQKKDLFGSANADVAKPWLNSIYVSYDSWESTLKHEIAHCFTAGFGWSIFKVASDFNPALIEGIAEAADGFYDENGIHYLAALAYKNDYRIDVNSLFSSFSFFSSVSSLSYIYSGSFIKFLINEYGIAKTKKFYSTNDFEQTYNRDIKTVIENYETFLDTVKFISTKASSNYYFGRKSLISKVCPRYISSRLDEAWNNYSKEELPKAISVFEDILSKSDNYSATVGLAKIYEQSDSIEKSIKLFQSGIHTFSGTSTEYDLKFRLAELYVKNFELQKASELYKEIANTKPSKRLQLLSISRNALILDGTISSYVDGSDFDKYLILKKLNSKSYNYATIPLMLNLSILLDEQYNFFIDDFKSNFEVKDEISSYAVYKVSNYMLSNFDFINARKFAGLALRYKENPILNELYFEHFNKTEWFVKNTNSVLNGIKYGSN